MRSTRQLLVGLVVTACLVLGVVAVPGLAADLTGKLKVPDAGNIQRLTLTDGSTLMGRITEVGTDQIKFRTDMGEMEIDIWRITDIKEISTAAMKGGKYWFPNPNRTRLYVGPTGRTLRKGEGYFNDVLIFFPSVSYGFTDNFSLGAGMTLFPGQDPDEQLYFVIPKLGVSLVEGWDMAVSAMIFRVPGTDNNDPKTIGILFLSGTVGSADHSLSLGLGYGFADGDMADQPAVMIGGETRIGRGVALVSENWLFPEVDEPVVSYGVRFFGETLAVDLALVNVLSEDVFFPGFPLISFVWNF